MRMAFWAEETAKCKIHTNGLCFFHVILYFSSYDESFSVYIQVLLNELELENH